MAKLWPHEIHRFFQTEIRGVALFLVIGTLGGIVAGFFGGLIYGHFLAERDIARELIKAKGDQVNYRLNDDGSLPSKISGGIRSDCGWAGITVGLPIGTMLGFLCGGVAFWVSRTVRKPSVPCNGTTQ